MGRPPGSPNKDKPYRDALRIEAKLAEDGIDTPALPGSLRWIARQQLKKAGDDTSAAREIADRLDGKPAQAIIGGDDDDPALNLHHTITRRILGPGDTNGSGAPPAP